MNKITICGRLVREPELKTFGADKIPFLNFTLGCNTNYKDKQGNYKSEFIDCVLWRKKAELVSQYCVKGSQLTVIGTLTSREYEKKDGTTAKAWEVQVEDVEFVFADKKETQPSRPQKTKKPKLEPASEDEDFPF